jgi:sRNA-binding protein
VLNAWKRRDGYCRAVLSCSARIGLDGSETGETVDDVARAKAGEMIAQREARRQREAQKADLRQARLSATDQPAIADAVVDPSAPNGAPSSLRAR